MMFLVTLVFIAADIVVGLVQAFATHSFQSCKMREGIVHKAVEMLIIGLGWVCNWGLPYIGIEITAPILPAICAYLVIMELASIIENIGKISPELKPLITKIFGHYIDTK